VAVVAVLAILGVFAEKALEEQKVASDLSLGQPATIDGLQVVVDRYEMSEAGRRAPAPGARFLLVHLTARNVGDVPIDEFVDTSIEYRGVEVGGSYPGPQHPMFDASVRLFPGMTSEGWTLFEVPVDLDLSEVTAVVKTAPFFRRVATWRLVESEETDGR
jgi:hypothetical protein